MVKDRSGDRHAQHRHMVGFDDTDWAELGQVVGGDPERGEVIRRLVAAFLGRPGARMPRRRHYETPGTQKPATPEDGGPNETPT